MQAAPSLDSLSTARLWTGIVLTGLVCLFLAFDGITKILKVSQVLKASEGLSLPSGTIVPIGWLLLACMVIHLIPKTAVLGALLLTGYLGGAVAIHLRAGAGAFPIVFSAAFGVLVWVGFALREPRLSGLIFLRQW
jgi:hypothetical protein